MGFVVMPVAAQMQQIQLVDQPLFFQQFDGAVHRNQVNARVNLLRAGKNLVHVKMLFSAIHHLHDHSPLAGQTNAPLAKRFGQVAGGFRTIDALAGGCAMRWRGGHERPFGSSRLHATYDREVIIRATSLYITYAKSSSRNTNPTCTNLSFTGRLRSRRINPSTLSIMICPPSRIGMGSRFRIPRLTLMNAISKTTSSGPRRTASPDAWAIPKKLLSCFTGTRPVTSFFTTVRVCPKKSSVLTNA